MTTMAARPRVAWPDEIDEILAGDLVAVVGMPTPRGGVALASVAPIGLRDRDRGTVSFTTSLGFGRKLERIAQDPRIAIAYHTRRHGHANRPGYVLVQGRAGIRQIEDWTRTIEQALAFDDQLVAGRIWNRWLRVYYWDRVEVTIAVERILWWPDGRTAVSPIVLGEPLPMDQPPDQDAPEAPCTPRVRPIGLSVAGGLGQLLLSVLQSDGMPLILPVGRAEVDRRQARLGVDSPLLPRGLRRAGLLAHDFHAHLVGLWTATHTGWLEVDPEVSWTPHTRHFFYAPPIKPLLLFGNGLAARLGYRDAIRKGRHLILQHATQAPQPAGHELVEAAQANRR